LLMLFIIAAVGVLVCALLPTFFSLFGWRHR
jgi:hypothetical protein